MRKRALRSEFETAIRSLLPRIRDVQTSLPTLPQFRPVPGRHAGRVRFLEEQRPNWGQLKRTVGSDFDTELQAIGQRFGHTEPFRSAIGKYISFPELGGAVRYDSPHDLVWPILNAYFTATGAGRWNEKTFRDVWDGFCDFLDPAVSTVKHTLYAPLAGLSGVQRSLWLERDLRIQRLTPAKVARIATCEPHIAGVDYTTHRLTLWPLTFLVHALDLKKQINTELPFLNLAESFSPGFVTRINEEAALLRALLSEDITMPTYAIISSSYPKNTGGGKIGDLPWRLPALMLKPPLSPKEVYKYKSLRTKFLGASGKTGWEASMASIRRFAVAWDNQFRADILADLVAALEQLLVRSDREVNYKLRVRIAFLLGQTSHERLQIVNNIRDAYGYRSTIYHGGFVFDNLQDYFAAKRMKRAKAKRGNPFHDVNEVNRLMSAMAGYYRRALATFIKRGQYVYDWAAVGL